VQTLADDAPLLIQSSLHRRARCTSRGVDARGHMQKIYRKETGCRFVSILAQVILFLLASSRLALHEYTQTALARGDTPMSHDSLVLRPPAPS
jgi:hypothetical protein